MSLSLDAGSKFARYRRHALLLGIWLLACMVSASAYGKCRLRFPYKFVAQDVALDMGTVVVAPDLPVGSVIKQLNVVIEEKPEVIRCGAKGYGQGEYVHAWQTMVPGFDNVYRTDVDGVGIRIYQSAGWLQGYYPFQTTNLSLGKHDISDGVFHVELIKTAEYVGSGAIADIGPYTRYYFDYNGPQKPAITSSFHGRGTTIVSPTCKVLTGSRNIVVDFGGVTSSSFSGYGSVAASRDFSIELDCRGGDISQYQSTISIRIDGLQDSSNMPGVLQIRAGANAASGIGIELVDMRSGSEAKLNLNKPIAIGRTVVGNKRMSLPLRARYVQTDEYGVTGGIANGSATFTITYQ